MNHPAFLLELTHRCNLTCKYCYGPWRKNPSSPVQELSTPQWLRLLDRLLEETSPHSVTLLGGDPLLSTSVYACARHLSNRGVSVALSTNGTLLDSRNVDDLLRSGLERFEVSLDSTDAAVYAELTGGSLDDVVRGLQALQTRRAAITLSVVLTRQALPGLENLIDFACAFGVTSLSLLRLLRPAQEGSLGLSPTKQQLLEALQRVNEKSRATGMPVSVGMPLEPCEFDRSRFPQLAVVQCLGGRLKWVIDPQGNLRVCEASPSTQGNLLTNRFSELSKSPAVQQFRSDARTPTCAECDWHAQCGGGCRFLCD